MVKLARRTSASLLLAGMIAAALGSQGRAQEIRDAASLIRAMHDRYQGNWYQTLTFTQQSTTFKPDGTSSSETWHEAASLPGELRIDMGPLSDGNGAIFAGGAVTFFKDGKAGPARPLVHMLMVLGFDVYLQDSQTTVEQIKSQGFDLSKLREDTWQGEPAYVVGADRGDTKSKQFWIEKKRLLFLRLIEPGRQDPTKTSDTRFVDYRQLPLGWVAAQVQVYVDGRKVFGEEYSDIQTNPKLDPAVFDPDQFASRHWEK